MANTKVTGDLIASSTIATGNIADNAVTSAKISGITTAHITEGSNLYYTDARARAAVSVSGNALSYNSSTGVITSNFEESPTFTGNVIISGTTNSGRLFVEQSGADMIDMTRTGVGTYRLAISTTDKFSIYDLGATSDRFVIDSSGNIGIGTTSPSSLLHLRDSNTNSDVGIKIGNDSRDWNLKVMGSVSDSFQIFTHDNSNVMTITSGGNVGIGATSPDRTLDVRGTGMSIYGTGDYTELMLRGQVEGTGTVRNVGSWHWSIRGDIGGDNDDLKLVRFVTGSYVGIAMQVQNSTGDIFFGNTVVNPASGFSNQRGFGYDNSTGNVQIAATSGNALTVGRNESSDGAIMTLRKESNVKHSFGSTTSYLLGNVGIGTTSPLTLLHINGSGDAIRVESTNTGAGGAQMDLLHYTTSPANEDVHGVINFGGYYSGTSSAYGSAIKSIWTDVANRLGRLTFYTRNASDFNAAMTVNHAGNVGIGTTSPDSKLNINGASAHLNFTGSNNRINFSGYRAIEGSHTGSLLQIGEGYSNIVLYGNVGIGTTSPSQKLVVSNGNIRIDSTNNANHLIIQNNATGTSGTFEERIKFLGWNDNENAAIIGIGNAYFGSPVNALAFSVSASEKMRILHSGNVGIGTTSPAKKLDIRTDNGVLIKGASGSTNASLSFLPASGGREYAFSNDGSSFYIKDISADVTRMYFHYNGNLGIGTTSPSYKLDVNGTLRMTSSYHQNVNFTNTPTFQIGSDTYSSGFYVYDSTAAQYRMVVKSSTGNVGIGTISPNRKLHVGGKAIIGQTNNYSSNSGTLHVYGSGSENSGILDIQNNGNYRYYTRVCHNASVSGNAGYWHIKTNISSTANIMFLAKFYGYIYGSAQVLDLQHSGYAYSATGTVINQGTTNNGSDANASSAIYISANGSKVTFRIAFGSGSNFSTYYCGVFMDIAFPNPAGAAHDFEIEAQSFSTNTTVY